MSTFPSSPKPSSAKVRSISPTFVSTAQNLRQVVSSRNAHRWAVELSFPPMKRVDFAPLWAFIVAQKGRAGSFDFVLPEHAPRGTWEGTPLVDGAGQTGTVINLKGFAVSKTGVAKAGDFVRFAGSYKTYMVAADANSDSAGKAALHINTTLVASPANSAAVSYDRKFRCALADDNADTDLSSDMFYAFKVQMMEVLY
jgi:hypothetical protein